MDSAGEHVCKEFLRMVTKLGLGLFMLYETQGFIQRERGSFKLSMVIILLQVLNSNLIPDCIRSNLRGSKFKLFLGMPPDPPINTLL